MKKIRKTYGADAPGYPFSLSPKEIKGTKIHSVKKWAGVFSDGTKCNFN